LFVRPARSVELRQDVFAASVRFGEEWHLWLVRLRTDHNKKTLLAVVLLS
jgi:hypothetical protein